jgi:ActR/RegA family two-component response regulator
VPLVVVEPPRVLLLRPADPLRERLLEALTRQGFDAVPSADAADAVELASRPPGFDMALVDVSLSGTDVVRALGESDPGLFVALLPGNASRDELVEGYRTGASAALRPAASPAEIARSLKAQLPAAGRRRRRAEERPSPRRSFGSGVVAWLRSRRVRRAAWLAAASLLIGVSLAAGVEWIQGPPEGPERGGSALADLWRQYGGDRRMERAILLEHLRISRDSHELTRRYYEAQIESLRNPVPPRGPDRLQ